jgi:hypothetical protein
MSNTATVIPITTLDQAVEAIHKKFQEENDSARKAQRSRVACGQMLLALRKRIEDGDAGAEWVDDWWGWYKKKFVRSRRDAEKVMKLARAADPDAAAEQDREKDRQQKQRHRAAADGSRNTRTSKTKDLVTHALRLVETMDASQRSRFFAILRREYSYEAN